MAFEGLSQKLSGALSKLTGRGKLTEQAVKDAICLIATDPEGEMFLNHWRALEKQFSQATL